MVGVGIGITQPPPRGDRLNNSFFILWVDACIYAQMLFFFPFSFFSPSQARGSRLPDILRVTGASQLQQNNLKEACTVLSKGVNLVAALVYLCH